MSIRDESEEIVMSESEAEDIIDKDGGDDDGEQMSLGDEEDGAGEDDEFEFVIEDDENVTWGLENPTSAVKEKNFISLNAEDLVNQQQDQVIHVHEVLGVPLGISGSLLRAYQWNKEQLFSDFFEDKQRVCKKAKVSLEDYFYHTGDKNKQMTCGICYDDYPGDQMLSLSCKHFLCRTCWRDYLEVAIKDGPSCLHTKCPYPKCSIVVDETLVKELVDPKIYKIYSKYIARSFVDDNPRIKWCPAPDCGKAVYCPETVTDSVQCSCGAKFCFKCNRESHVPASCEQVAAWQKKEKDESETATWLTANTKDCPKCNRSIEKNGGCNHMTCSLCKHEFCWVCMDPWSTHSTETGGFYKCNKYKAEELEKKTGAHSRESARAALEKYMHYYTRYANHDKSQRFEKQLREKCEQKMKELTQINKYSSWVDVEYIQRAVNVLIECRGSLKYTYVYGYYLEDGREKELFEYLQEDLERVTEKLSEILENTPVENFNRDEIISTSRSAEKRLEHLLNDSKSGLTVTRETESI
jgi:ariadne-1